MDRLKVAFEGLTLRQAAKWFLIHEYQRHIDDIISIRKDLTKLNDVELPPELEDLCGNIWVEIFDGKK